MWIDVTNAAGTPYGDGPITTATHWTNSAAIDKAGRFAFTMPATDPRAALLQNLRYVYCYEMVGGVATLLGAGIIDKRALAVGDPTMLTVSGPDLLAELAARTIPTLTVCEQALTYLTENEDTGHWTGSVRWISNRYGAVFDVDLPESHDGVTASGGELVTMWSEGDPNIEYVYVGCDARFDRIYITVGDYLETNRRESVLVAQYYNGSGWVDLADVWDGTAAQNMAGEWCTFAQTGAITFTRPADWARVQPTAQAGSWFWVRLTVAAGQETDEIRLREAAVWADVPTTDGVNQIMAYAPDTWTKTGYPQTATPKYLEIEGESVLAALIALSEQGGQVDGAPVREHFTLGPGRAITWFSAFADSGLRAVQGSLPRAGQTCLIKSLRETVDTSETVTRLYPCSNDGIGLALTTRTPPAGYSLNAAEGWLQHDAGATAYGRIEASPRYTDIQSQQADSWYEHPSMVANAVFDRALEYLRTHGEAQTFYSLEVVGAPASLGVGQTIRVVYHEYRDGYHMVDIDADLYIVGTQNRIGSDGIRTLSLDVATVDRAAQTDAGMIVGAIRDVRRVGTAAGGSTNVTVTGGGGDGASFPGTVSPETINTDTGSEHFHRVDLSTHIANAAAHHAPVTVGNTGLALSTQQLSLNLAAVSGLDIATGLMLADSIAGAGLTITNKVLSVGAGDGVAVAADSVSVALAVNSGLQMVSAKLAMRTPSLLDAFTANAVTDALGHTHAIRAYADSTVDTQEGHLLKSDATGSLKLASLTLTGNIAAAGVASHLIPTLPDTYDLGSSTKLWRKGWLSELDAVLFAENTITLLGGWFIVGKGQGTLPGDVAAGDATVDFGQAMTPGHIVVLRSSLAVEYVTVGALVSGTTYNVTRNVDGSGANDWPAGSVYLVLGASGDGRIELNAYDTPRVQIVRQGAAYNQQTEIARLGDLNGGWGYSTETWGLAVGEYAAGKGNLVYDQANGLRLRTHGTDKIVLDNAGAAYFAGVVTIGTNGEIRQGTGTLGADYTGLRIWHDSGVGCIGGYNANTLQWYGSTDGKLYAGGGKTTLDANGIRMLRDIIYTPGVLEEAGAQLEWGHYESGAWVKAGTIETGRYHWDVVLAHQMTLQVHDFTGAAMCELYLNGFPGNPGTYPGGNIGMVGSDVIASVKGTFSVARHGGSMLLVANTVNSIVSVYGSMSIPVASAGMEMGLVGSANTPYIDFHSSANVNDYDARLMASGGAASHGQGTLSAHAALLSVTGAMRAGAYVQASGSTVTALKMNQFTLADEASARLIADSATPYGLIAVICLSEVSVALFAVFSGGNVTVISDPSNVYRNTFTDGYHCVYWSGSEFILTNRRGGSRQYHIHALTTIY